MSDVSSKQSGTAQTDLSQYGLDRAESGDDVSVPFTLEELDSRGRAVRLAKSVDGILGRHKYPEPVARLLAEAVVLASLIGSALKFEGRFILQTQTNGPINMIVVDLDAPDGLRGYARFDADAIKQAEKTGKLSAPDLLGAGHLAMTIDQGTHMDRYQGIVQMDNIGFEEAAHHYFAQSEQIPTQVRIAVGQLQSRGEKSPSWRAAGMIVQFIPEAGEAVMADLPGDGDFDNTETNDTDFVEQDTWVETQSLFSTLSDAELVDPDVSAERLLFRLYHEKGVRVFAPENMQERCSCSAQRIEDMLSERFSPEDRADMVVDGQIEVVCEFCSSAYQFSAHQFETEH